MHQTPLEQARELIAPLLRRAGTDAGPAARILVGIVGPPGAGKSTLAEALAAAFAVELATELATELAPGSAAGCSGGQADGSGPRAAVAVPMDGFHLSNVELERLGLADRKGAPETFDAAGFVHLVRRLRSGTELVYAPAYSRRLHESIGGVIAVDPAVRLVLVEGNYLLLPRQPWARLRPMLDLAVYLDVSDPVRVRGLVRRQRARGLDAAAAADWVQRSDEANARLVATTRAYADAVLTRH